MSRIHSCRCSLSLSDEYASDWPSGAQAGSVSSAYDRAAVLLEILKQQSLSSPAREVFLDVAQAITSQHEQNRVLAELVRSERR